MAQMTWMQSAADARTRARRRLPRMLFDFIDGATGQEHAKARNRTALDMIALQPRVLTGAGGTSLATALMGNEYGLPLGIAPMGMCDLSWPGADRAYADLAQRWRIPHCVSTAASTSLEQVHAWAGEHAWFQLYVGETAAGWALVERALETGYKHLIFTVDTPHVSRRHRELKRGFEVPFRLRPRQLWDFATHPHWSLATLMHGVPSFGNNRTRNDGREHSDKPAFERAHNRDAVDWQFLDALRARWPHQLIVKGVLSAADAVRIQAAGADAVYVSNHGGRQLDSAPAAIDCLGQIRQAVGEHYPLIFDSGLRDGDDIIKALASGADFVMLGRPWLYAVAAAGAAGVEHLMVLLESDLKTVMAQLGVAQIKELDGRVLRASFDIT
jgi:isopentenyl diphosphate isomerase/L-lactate dehydrogenase-like FMN-dependent dehydrogenase